MQYRPLGSTGADVSLLGFGAMRLPQKDGKYDDDYSVEIIHKAFENGVNYLDTAPGYCSDQSERICALALKGWRDKVYISTKNGCNRDPSGKNFRERLEKSLQTLEVDYIDYYQLWGLNLKGWHQNILAKGGPLQEAQRARDEGLIKHICFSYHDKPENALPILGSGEFECMTIQYNIMNRGNELPIAYAYERGIGVVVMGPVGGGILGTPSATIAAMVPEVKSTAEMALRFVWSNPAVSTAISGMNHMDQVTENLRTAALAEPLTAEERAQVMEQLDEFKRLGEKFCTECGYCMDCEHGVDIPKNFRLYNHANLYGLEDWARRQYAKLEGKADLCTECGECEPKCPQDIPIIAQLKLVHERFG
ncbi:MAG: aldo/keto reductase [Armatimonadota bacterium]